LREQKDTKNSKNDLKQFFGGKGEANIKGLDFSKS